MIRNFLVLPLMFLLAALSVTSAHAATDRAQVARPAGSSSAGRIDSIRLSSSTLGPDGVVRITVTGSGNCVTRIEHGGVQRIAGKSYTDIAGGFPKFVSLTAQGAPGSHRVRAHNADSRDASCVGSASATLTIIAAAPGGRAQAAATGLPATFAVTVPATLVAAPPATQVARIAAPVIQAAPGPIGNIPTRSPADMLMPAGAGKRPLHALQAVLHEPGQLVILWDDVDEGERGLQILARDYQVRPIQRAELASLGGLLATFQLRDDRLAVLLRDLLRPQYPSWHIDLHARYQSLGGPRMYLPAKIDAPATPALLPALRVGMLDTAVAPIRALQAATLTQHSFLAATDMPAPTAHGTAIATLIAGQDAASQFHALAAGARLYVGAIMREHAGQSGSNTATVIRGLDWLIGSGVQVINLSLGGPGDDLMASVFARLQRKRVIIVAAAGNGGPDAAPSYPAAYPGVLAVTAVDAADQAYRRANQGAYIMLAAPGVDLWTPDAASGHYVSGTSFSAAVVTGAVGVMLAQRAELTPERVREKLCRNARDLGVPGFDPVYGCGVVQVNKTLAALE